MSGMYCAAVLLYSSLSFALLPGSAPQPPPARERGLQPHLGAWLQRHEKMPPGDRERALAAEPGFNQLRPEAQLRLMERLHQIDRMKPEQKQRTLDRIEAMEKLTPQAREQIRNAAQELRALPADRQLAVKAAFRDLRAYPLKTRESLLRSGPFQSRLSPQERGILSNLLSIEPYRP